MKTFRRKLEKMLLVVHLSFLRVWQLLYRFHLKFYKYMQTFLWGLKVASYSIFRWVISFRPVVLRSGIKIQRRVDPCRDESRPCVLKSCSGSIFKESEQNIELQLLYFRWNNFDRFSVHGFVLIATHCLKPWSASIKFVSLNKYVDLSLKKIFNLALRKESSVNWKADTCNEKNFNLQKMKECEWWRLDKINTNGKLAIWECLPKRRSHTDHQLPEETRNWKFLG